MKTIKKLLRMFLNKWALFAFIIFLEIIALVLVFIYAGLSAGTTVIITSIIHLVLVAISIVSLVSRKEYHSRYIIAWLVLVAVIPVAGSLFYLFTANTLSHKARQRKYKINSDKIKKVTDEIAEEYDVDPYFNSIQNLVRSRSHLPAWDKTDTKIYNRGEDMYEDIKEALLSAKEYIFLEFFIVRKGKMLTEILEIIQAKLKEGVKVYFIYDNFGGSRDLPFRFKQKIRKMGVKTKTFNRIFPTLNLSFNYRDHRKIVVVDGKIAFTGGINIGDEYINREIRFGYWKDGGIRLKGKGVANFALIFLNVWETLTKEHLDPKEFIKNEEASDAEGYVISFQDGPLNYNHIIHEVYLTMINTAQKYIYISTPYLILDDEILLALKIAAARGIDVRIITPKMPDKKFVFMVTKENYKPLIEAGVRIYEYTPGFIHTKAVVSDDDIGTIGTSNFDFRSFYLHYEDISLIYKTKSVKDLRNDFIETFAISEEIEAKDIKRNNIFKRALLVVLKILSPLL
ncbi:MAG TPA: cardiolipin synthase [Bacilli bacterium]|jgi:cardiolipin synthase|nr:cardiolipin synthase [Bacilli bacterium]HPX83297.1 cardiolipin synthase [Bacilli bacterium]HQB80086.1 cardiolipin synthase [Bacilli bacterium]HQM17956.1 cardiolipin synthase [Bacilli bacterium]